MREPDLFSIPPEQPDDDAHWDRATGRVVDAMARQRDEDRGWFIREPRQAWGTAMIVAILATVIVLVPLMRRTASVQITLLPDEPLARAFLALDGPPPVSSLLIEPGTR